MTQIIEDIRAWRKLRGSSRLSGKSLGFVPTMGALHAGHMSLVQRSRSENDLTLVSIFVNPAQFNDRKDLNDYPRNLEADLVKLQAAGTDFLFCPKYENLYPDNYRFRINESEISKTLCGKFRAGHFQGVLTVVMKLLVLAAADRAYFGEKDFQQYILVKEMTDAFFLDSRTQIIACPTVREEDGLAMSSRNRLLTGPQRKLAAHFPRLLRSGSKPDEIKAELEKLGFKVDYIEEWFNRRLGAVHLGNVRLIDNVKI